MFSFEKVITYANIAAGLSVSKFGGRLSVPSLNEVISYYNQKFPLKVDKTEENLSNQEDIAKVEEHKANELEDGIKPAIEELDNVVEEQL